jgi:hypothetical protein
MEPHTNYKHKTSLALATLCQSDSNYTEALSWLDKADTLYQYWGFEGSLDNIAEEQENILSWEVDILLKQHKKEEAIRQLVTRQIYGAGGIGYFSHTDSILFSLIDKKSFKTDFDNALNNLTIRTMGDKNWVADFTIHGLGYHISISKEIPDRNIPHFWKIYFVKANADFNKQYFVDSIKDTRFYQQLEH